MAEAGREGRRWWRATYPTRFHHQFWLEFSTLSGSLFRMFGDYSGAAWQFLESVKCYWSEYCLSYATVEGLSLWKCKNSTYLDSHQPKSVKTGTN